MNGERTKLLVIRCLLCDQRTKILVNPQGYFRWQHGTLIQNALPELTNAERELLISGTCNECFNKLFAE